MRPFGISTLIVGFDPNDTRPRLYQTEPSGIFSAWKANAIGRSSKTVREFLEKNHKDDLTREESIKLTVKSLLEVVQTGAKNIEISVMEGYGKITNLALEQIEEIVQEIEREKEAGTSLFTLVLYEEYGADGHCRGGEEEDAFGSYSCGTGGDGFAGDGHTRCMISSDQTVCVHSQMALLDTECLGAIFLDSKLADSAQSRRAQYP